MNYFSSLQQTKWLSLTSFMIIIGITGIVANQVSPPPGYTAQGMLSINQPPVTFSNTSVAILKQGEQLTPQILLAENVMKAVAEFVQQDPAKIRETSGVIITQNPLLILVQHRGQEESLSVQITEGLMKAMIEQSRLINVARWEQIQQSIQERFQQVSQELKTAETQLDNYTGFDQREIERLEKQVQSKQEAYDQVQKALEDVKVAQQEVISSFMIRQLPEIIAKPGFHPRVQLAWGMGSLLAIFVSLGIIPGGKIWQETQQQKKREEARLQAILYRLILKGNGKVSLTRFALESKVSPEIAQHYLNRQAEILNGTCETKEEGSILYYFSLGTNS